MKRASLCMKENGIVKKKKRAQSSMNFTVKGKVTGQQRFSAFAVQEEVKVQKNDELQDDTVIIGGCDEDEMRRFTARLSNDQGELTTQRSPDTNIGSMLTSEPLSPIHGIFKDPQVSLKADQLELS